LEEKEVKKVLVTGGMGFIGRYVVENLLDRGYEPIIFDHQRRAPEEYPEGVEVFMGDVRDSVHVTEAMAHVDGWIHLAACLGTQETIQNPYPAAETNLLGGLNVLQAAAQYDIPGVYIAVGNYWMNNPYSITKNMIERFVQMYNKDRGTKVNVVRAVNAYGPRQLAAAPFGPGKVRKITPAFVCRALSEMPIEVYGDGSQVSDMVYVGDVAEALVRSLEKAAAGVVFDKAVEVGPSEHHTVQEVACIVCDLVAVNPGKFAGEIVNLPMRPGEIAGSEVTADNSTLELIDMNDASLTSLIEGMRQTVDYFAESEGKAWHVPEHL
jgi:UDP-glucose 4-epimerase